MSWIHSIWKKTAHILESSKLELQTSRVRSHYGYEFARMPTLASFPALRLRVRSQYDIEFADTLSLVSSLGPWLRARSNATLFEFTSSSATSSLDCLLHCFAHYFERNFAQTLNIANLRATYAKSLRKRLLWLVSPRINFCNLFLSSKQLHSLFPAITLFFTWKHTSISR